MKKRTRCAFSGRRWLAGVLAAVICCAGCGAGEEAESSQAEPPAQESSSSTAETESSQAEPPVQESSSSTAEAESSQAEPPAQESSSSTAETEEGLTPDAWNLLLVNPWNPLPGGYTVNLAQVNANHAVDERCYEPLQQMLEDCRAAGLSPVICSSYRTQAVQERLFYTRVDNLVAQGYSQEDAQTITARGTARPGTSEHQLGLAVDLVDLNYQILDNNQENTPVQQWLMEHCWEYGFILRYPNEKSAVTGIIYEPWHYRYVGREAAKEITESGLCLEEYLETLAQGNTVQ